MADATPVTIDAAQFTERLMRLSPREAPTAGHATLAPPGAANGADALFAGIRMGDIFALAKEFVAMAPAEIEALLESPVHEVRVGALSIMDKQARLRRTPEERRKELFDLYLRRSDRIDNWDLVDLGSPHVVGRYLFDKPRDVLYELARSASPWERRTAIVSTLYLVRQGDVDDTFRIAEILLTDEEHLLQTATGGLLREAGKKDRPQLLAFLDRHAAQMPRTLLRYAIERLEPELREHYRRMR
ncbi:MAG TPA: DNA alkylation repair protein [Conexibacter sp.]|nr:DNA alkylation repair protein [Conexibacter sp.]